jgi:hypothetical protein
MHHPSVAIQSAHRNIGKSVGVEISGDNGSGLAYRCRGLPPCERTVAIAVIEDHLVEVHEQRDIEESVCVEVTRGGRGHVVCNGGLDGGSEGTAWDAWDIDEHLNRSPRIHEQDVLHSIAGKVAGDDHQRISFDADQSWIAEHRGSGKHRQSDDGAQKEPLETKTHGRPP